MHELQCTCADMQSLDIDGATFSQEHTRRCMQKRRIVDRFVQKKFANAASQDRSRQRVLEWLQRRDAAAAAAAEGPGALLLRYQNREICDVMHDLNRVSAASGWPVEYHSNHDHSNHVSTTSLLRSRTLYWGYTGPPSSVTRGLP